MSKTIVITGGTGGIGYQEALLLAGKEENHTIVIAGRCNESANKAVESIKAETGNKNIHYALADLSIQSQVKGLAEDLIKRFPKIDELIHNAGNLTTGEKETTVDGVEKNFAVNVIAPLLLTRALIPALKAAMPTGKVQITSGGIPTDTIDMKNLEGEHLLVGIANYSHSKRVMEAMTVAFSREIEPEGIVVNIVGGAKPGATSMIKAIGFKDMPNMMKPVYPLFKLLLCRDDDGKSARACATPCVKAVFATADGIGTGRRYMKYPREGKLSKVASSEENQATILKYIESRLV